MTIVQHSFEESLEGLERTPERLSTPTASPNASYDGDMLDNTRLSAAFSVMRPTIMTTMVIVRMRRLSVCM